MSPRRALTAVAVAGAAALAVVVPAAMAQASTGDFVSFTQGTEQILTDQPSDQCTTIQIDRSGPIVNQTDSLALVYLTPDCTGPVQVVYPGEFTRLRLPFAGSVLFEND